MWHEYFRGLSQVHGEVEHSIVSRGEPKHQQNGRLVAGFPEFSELRQPET
jgi:hypothetical protein